MGTRSSLRSAGFSLSLGFVLASQWAVQGFAAVSPKYFRLREFGVVLDERSIPDKVGGLIARIERVGDGRYRVHGGRCHVDVLLHYQPPPRGVLGSSRISIARVGKPRC